ncbi:LAQU0S22e00364g1_1 [Lachancea quebecensis]|uniref:Mitochondrial genome maintenance protein MGM101 n=1 Tax=Lachancea quebecensis TaxID=1654605 RepID=A0A0P1KY13_9SACH|nr:LAQU0S22e00364g1_1 [Lachancea quebecensis]
MFRLRSVGLLAARRNAVTAVKRVANTRTPTTAGATGVGRTQESDSTVVPPSEHKALRASGFGKPLNNSLRGYNLEGSHPNVQAQSQDNSNEINWAVSFQGLGSRPFENVVQLELAKPLAAEDIEIKPDGLVYLPEIKYRRILNKAFGAGGWGLVPRSETTVTDKLVTREYALVCHGQLVSLARGEQDYFAESGIPTATEGCKSNALMRCCKDLGIGSELWDPVFIKSFKKSNCVEKFVEHVTTKKKRKIWLRKDREVEYPYK